MARGDQVYVMRPWIGLASVYEHHGIDCGDGTVIHYRKTGAAAVSRTSMALFDQGQPITIKRQPVAFLPDAVVERAKSRLGERRYDLLLNNCEHFATWCKTGRNESEQVAGFGFQLDRFKGVNLRRLIEGTTRDRSPEDAISLFKQALGDISGAHHTLQTQYQRAKHDADTWQRVAQTALNRGREDLARAALHRKVKAQKKMDMLTQQLTELVEVQLTLEQSRRQSEQGLP